MDHKEKLHSIQQVSTNLNIPKPTLRFWEKEFDGLLQPLRTDGGQRRYTCEHIAIVEKINAFKKAGFSLVEIKRALRQGQTPGIENWMPEDERMEQIDLLAERVAQVVKLEILRFIQRDEG